VCKLLKIQVWNRSNQCRWRTEKFPRLVQFGFTGHFTVIQHVLFMVIDSWNTKNKTIIQYCVKVQKNPISITLILSNGQDFQVGKQRHPFIADVIVRVVQNEPGRFESQLDHIRAGFHNHPTFNDRKQNRSGVFYV